MKIEKKSSIMLYLIFTGIAIISLYNLGVQYLLIQEQRNILVLIIASIGAGICIGSEPRD